MLHKPSGLLVHNSAWAGPREHTLVDEARTLLGEGFHPVHRLDRGTSGVVLFARDVARAQEALARADADKRYWALVRGHLRARVVIDHPIRDDDAPDAQGRPAQSVVRPLLLSSVERCALVEVQLLTGRRHQARRHLKHIAHPILGDATHGKGPLNRFYRDAHGLGRLALHARSLSITHPSSQARITVMAPLPADLRVPLERLFGAALGEVLLDGDRALPLVAAPGVSR